MNNVRHQGFTIIEIMVVITIIGIMTGLIAVSMTTTDPQKQLNREALRFKALIQMAQEEALFSQEEIGVIVNEQGYKFARWSVVQPVSGLESDDEDDPATTPVNPLVDNNTIPPTWNLMAEEKEFRAYELSEEFEIILEVDQEQINLNAGEDPQRQRAKRAEDILEEEEEELEPNIFILSSGEISPFVMEMYVKDNSDVMAKISANEAGKVWIGDEDEEDEDSF